MEENEPTDHYTEHRNRLTKALTAGHLEEIEITDLEELKLFSQLAFQNTSRKRRLGRGECSAIGVVKGTKSNEIKQRRFRNVVRLGSAMRQQLCQFIVDEGELFRRNPGFIQGQAKHEATCIPQPPQLHVCLRNRES